MNKHTIPLQILTTGSLLFCLFSIDSIASPLDKNEILSILKKSSGVSKTKRKQSRNKVKKVPHKPIVKTMPQMKNNPYKNELLERERISDATVEIAKVKSKKLEFGRLPNIRERAIIVSENRRIVSYKKKHSATQKNNFDSTKYLEVLFN